MRKNLAAFTPPGINYPPYVSIYQEDGEVEIIVRSPVNADGRCGDTASIRVSLQDFDNLIDDIMTNQGA